MQGQKELKSKEELELKRDLYLKKKMQEEQTKAGEQESEKPSDSLQFELKLTTEDFWKFSLHYSMSGPKGIFNVLFTVAAVFLLITRWSNLSGGYRVMLTICALIFTVWQPLLLLNKAHKQAKSPAMQTPMILTFGEEGLLVEQNEQHVQFAWEQMGRMERTSSLVILYMDRVHAYLLPKRILGEREEALYKMARVYLKSHQLKKI